MENTILKSKQELDEIKQIKLKLIERYNIDNIVLLQALAVELIKNGISIDKFNPFYYEKNGFDLDEIVYYLLDRISHNKIIDFNTRKKKILTKRNKE